MVATSLALLLWLSQAAAIGIVAGDSWEWRLRGLSRGRVRLVGEGALNQEPANQASLDPNLEGLFGLR